MALGLGIGAAIGAGLIGATARYGGGLLSNSQNHEYRLDENQQKFGFDSALEYIRHINDLEKQKIAQGNALELADFNRQAELEKQRLAQEWEANKYSRAVDDLRRAGINIGAMGMGGLEAPTVAGGSSSVKPVGFVSSANTGNDAVNAMELLAKDHYHLFKKYLHQAQAISAKAIMSALK